MFNKIIYRIGCKLCSDQARIVAFSYKINQNWDNVIKDIIIFVGNTVIQPPARNNSF